MTEHVSVEKGHWLEDGFINGQIISEYFDTIKALASFRTHNYGDSGEK